MWNENYRIGVDVIDNEHQRLFEMVDDLSRILKESDEDVVKKARCKRAVIFMKAYVVMHFADEEDYQKRMVYSGYKNHKRIHDEFTANITKYETKLEDCDYDLECVTEFTRMLEMWLINHVENEDQLLKGIDAI